MKKAAYLCLIFTLSFIQLLAIPPSQPDDCPGEGDPPALLSKCCLKLPSLIENTPLVNGVWQVDLRCRPDSMITLQISQPNCIGSIYYTLDTSSVFVSGDAQLMSITDDGICHITWNINVRVWGDFSVQYQAYDSWSCSGPSFNCNLYEYVSVANGAPKSDFTLVAGANRFISFSEQAKYDDARIWDFGDGNTSTLANPTHTYGSDGYYFPSLTVSQNRCHTSIQDRHVDTLVLGTPPPMARFGYYNGPSFVQFSDSTVNWTTTTYNWDFGDGTTGTTQHPFHIYSLPGTYTVCLIASSTHGSDTMCKSITVNGCGNPAVDFTAVFANSNFQMTFTPVFQGVNPQSFTWLFGDGMQTTVTSDSSVNHIYSQPGYYNVCVIANDSCGVDTLCRTIYVRCLSPDAAFTIGYYTTNRTKVFFGGQNNVTSHWDFGDGSPLYSGTDAIHHYSLSLGWNYWDVSHFVSLGPSCRDTSYQTLSVYCPSADADFWVRYANSNVNNGLDIFPTENGLNKTYIRPTTKLWDMGDGTTYSGNNYPRHTYQSPGTYTVSLILTNPCDTDTVSKQIKVPCFESNPNFSVSSNTGNFGQFSHSGAPGGNWSYIWHYGDGTVDSLLTPASRSDVQHVYPGLGRYTVCLEAYNDCDHDSICRVADFICPPLPSVNFNFSAQNKTVKFKNWSSGGTQFHWDFGDGNTDTIKDPTHTYANVGTYTVTLINSGPCITDTVSKTVQVTCNAPIAGYTHTVTGNQLTLSNTSTTSGANPSLLWYLGNGVFDSTASPSYTYALPGNYLICLKIDDVCGADTLCQQVTIAIGQPLADFNSFPNGRIVQFSNQSTTYGSPTYSWDFGDGTSSTLPNPNHTYSSTGTFQVCLIVQDSVGNDTICKPVTVLNCAGPSASFRFTKVWLDYQFRDSTVVSGNAGYVWDFGDGSTSTQQHPQHYFNQPGTYQVCLTVTDSCGSSQSCQMITAACPTSPVANFSYTQSGGKQIGFRDLSQNIHFQWHWDFGDGTTDSVQYPVHTFPGHNTYNVCLIVTGFCGVKDTFCTPITVNCFPSNWGLYIHPLTPPTYAFSTVDVSNGTSWLWDFGNGDSSQLALPSYTYTFNGLKKVCLTITDTCGTDSVCQWLKVTGGRKTNAQGIVVSGEGAAAAQFQSGAPSWMVFPNPSSGDITLQGTQAEDGLLDVELRNMLGVLVRKWNWQANGGSVERLLKIRDLPRGRYVLLLKGEGVHQYFVLVLQ